MKPFFTQSTVSALQPRELLACGAIQFTSVSGAVTIQFGDGSPITVATGSTFHAPWPLLFDKVTVIAGAAGSATFVHGIGSLGSAGGSSSSGGGTVQPTSGSPEGALNASAGQWAYDSNTGEVYLNPNTTGTTGWALIIS